MSKWSMVLLLSLLASAGARASEPAVPDVTIAFFGDQGLGEDAEQVLQLVADEAAHAVVHLGDFDYEEDPAAWDAQIDAFLGADFPYFACVGNHDEDTFYGPGGYQEVLEARMNRLGIPWEGDLGVRSSFHFEGVFVVFTAPDDFGDGDAYFAPYIRDVLAADRSPWSISAWHRNMRKMQVGGKGDDTGWGVYEESRRGGAIIATAHEHSYSRTHLLSDMENQVVASTSQPLLLAADDPATAEDEGRSFVFVSGIGGKSIRDQERDGPWWASIYTRDQDGQPGALFGVFNYQGNPNLARFYFKNVDGEVVDDFFVARSPDPEPPALSIDDVSIQEGDTGLRHAVFQVTLSFASDDEVAVDYASGGGDATAGVDYEPVAGRLVFPAGSTSQTLGVPVAGDASAEGDETLLLTLSRPAGATLARESGVATIVDDDAPEPLPLAVSTQGSGTVILDPPGGAYPAGTQVTLTAVAGAGHAFAGWSGDLSGAANPATLVVDRAAAVSAQFVALEPSLQEVRTGKASNAGSVSTSQPLAAVEDDLYLAAVAVKPHTTVTAVSGLGLAWSPLRSQCSGRSQTGLAVWMAHGRPTSNGVVTATLGAPVFNSVLAVSRYAGVGATDTLGSTSANTRGIAGTCTGGSDSESYSFPLAATASDSIFYLAAAARHRDHLPGPGWIERAQLFSGSLGDVAGVSVSDLRAGAPVTANGRFGVNIDWAVVAVEIPLRFRLDVEPSPGGTVTLDPPGGVYAKGTPVALTATPDPGFAFAGWSGALAGAANPTTLVIDGDARVSAAFVPAFSVWIEPSAGGSVVLDPPGGRYTAGTPVTVTAMATAGHAFAGWSGDLSGTTNPASLVVVGDATVGARFVALDASLQELRSGKASNASSVSTSTALAAVNDDLYLAAVAFKPHVTVTGVSGLGLAWSRLRAQCSGRSQTGLEVWMARGRPTSDGVVTATLAASVSNTVLAVSRHAGVGEIDPAAATSANTRGVAGACSGGSDSESYALPLQTTAPDSLVYVAAAARHRDHVPGPGWIERAQLFSGSLGDVAGVSVADLRAGAPGPVSANGRFGVAIDWAVVAFEIPLPRLAP